VRERIRSRSARGSVRSKGQKQETEEKQETGALGSLSSEGELQETEDRGVEAGDGAARGRNRRRRSEGELE
jgi:hypothetical protein